MTGDFAAFMTARYDEAEALARAAMHDTRGEWNRRQDGPDWPTGHLRDDTDTIVVYDEGSPTDAEFDHIAACDPAHRLADITLKRAILRLYVDQCAKSSENALEEDRAWTLWPVVAQLGTEFAGHPEYRKDEWAP